MFQRVTYDDKFDDLWMHLNSKYTDKLFDLDGVGDQLDMSKFSKKFFASKVTADSSVDANANVDDVSVITYNTELPKPFFKVNSYYVLWKQLRKQYGLLMANKIIEMQLVGDIYIHDFHGISGGFAYCFNYSTYDIMVKGLPMVKKIKSIPPKYLYAFKSQLEQFTVVASNSTLGATGLADIFIVMSYYVDKMLKTGRDAHFELLGIDLVMSLDVDQRDLFREGINLAHNTVMDTATKEQWDIYNEYGFDSEEFFNALTGEQIDTYDTIREKVIGQLIKTFSKRQQFLFERNIYKYVKENIVSFIYTINQPMRANQSPFTNVSIYDDYFLQSMIDDYIFPDGSCMNIKTVKKIQSLYLDIMNKELERTPITFPITTANFSKADDGSIQDKEFKKFIARKNLKFGFINLYFGNTSTLSSCCRLRSDKSMEYFNSFGSGSSKIGSLGVCSIGFPRLAYKSIKTEDKFDTFFGLLRDHIEVCAAVNNAKRHIVKKRMENGNLPLYTHGFAELSKQYSTVGVNGLNECVEIMGLDILTAEGQEFVLEILKVINEENSKYMDLYKAPHNCEQVPGENMSIKMASKDKVLRYQDTYNIYSNQFIPLTTQADMLDRVKLQGLFDKHFSGGAICHLNVEQEITEVEYMEDLFEMCCQMGVVYTAVNYNLQECEDGHMTVGKSGICNICGKRVINNYTRIVGFLVSTKNWHKVRREEDYPFRQWY